MNRLEKEAQIGKAGTLATQISRLDVVLLDEIGYAATCANGAPSINPPPPEKGVLVRRR